MQKAKVAKGHSSRFTQQALAGSRSRVEGARRNPIVEIGEFRRGDGVRKNRAKGSEGMHASSNVCLINLVDFVSLQA